MRFDHQKIFNIYWLSFKVIGFYAVMQLVFSAFGIMDPFLRQFLGKLARPHAMAYEPSFYALYMCLFVMFYNAMFVLGESKVFKISKFVPLFIVNILLIVSTSTGAFFAYLIFLGIVFCFSFLKDLKEHAKVIRKNLLKLSGFLIFVFSLFASFFPKVFLSTFFKFFVGLALTHWSFTIRLQGMINSWNVFLDYPFFGVGLGGVGPYLYRQFSPEGDLPKNLSELEIYDPTNVLTEVLASLGLYGLIVFCLLGCVIVRLFLKAISLPDISKQEKLQASALFISLIVAMIVLQFNQGLFRTYLWVHTAMNVGFFLKLIKLHNNHDRKVSFVP
jgi:O-antigen ligase